KQTGGYFLLRDHSLSKIFPLGSTAPYVARTFLPRIKPGAIKQPAVCKNNTFIFSIIRSLLKF
ncbi:MAG TPA: hypothetical protein VFD91_06655, partial [Mariniphaga sp.]|nr:hypothetical protein [Mariniphaga sp.]